MSKRYKGSILSATPPTLQTGAGASGAWTVDQQMQATGAGKWPVNGPFYVEDVFSTYLYTGNGSTQTITNGIDLSGKGGLVWLKGRSLGYNNGLFDTVRGADFLLCSNNTDPSISVSGIPANAWITGFNSNGFGLGSNGSANNNGTTYASWTFREQSKFFDVVTWTGNGANRTIAHNLGSVPGCILVKSTSLAGTNWAVYHRSLTSAQYALQLNNTGAQLFKTAYWNSTAPTSTEFSLGNDTDVNENGYTYVAYLFAHDAGGFGLTGTDNVVSCGSFTTDGSGNATVTLGYEPQWLLIKGADYAGGWYLTDTMRGWANNPSGRDATLSPNTSAAESSAFDVGHPTATGFYTTGNASSKTYIYIAIRRGPMKTPTSGTSVYQGIARTGTGANATIATGFVTDLAIGTKRSVAGSSYKATVDRLRGTSPVLFTNTTDAESASTDMLTGFDSNTGYKVGADTTYGYFNESSASLVSWNFRRAPGFFDEVCYTGTGVARTVNHNLGVAPELVIYKNRSGIAAWAVQSSSLPSVTGSILQLESTNAVATVANCYTTPTSTTVGFGSGAPADGSINQSGNNYVAYLFASCPGVSKVGNYTGNGSSQTINCGFTAGARFILIKRTDSAGSWYVWDTARGINPGNDPYLLLNSTAAEVTTDDSIDPDSSGFIVNQLANDLNVSGGTYIYLAIA